MYKILKSSLIILGLSIFVNTSIFGQLAPNFTVTDSDGNVHRLYEDYLNQGKTVLVKIFFVNCPPCNAIAPSVQNLYRNWGSGNHDVEFFELSNKSFDSNADVKAYKQSLGLTFPGVGEDGGALTALQPYLIGNFGAFFGTPTFFVIGPDRMVNFDVRGPGQAGTINALDQAIASTGAQKPGTTVQASQFRVIANDAFGKSIDNFDAFISSANSSTEFPINLNAEDKFSITNLNNEFPGLTNPVIRIRKSDTVREKLSAIDILIIVRHIIGLIPITNPDLIIAADTNGDGNINAIDLITLQRVILEQIPTFPTGNSFKFVPAEIPISLSPGELQSIEFDGIKIGDLNGF